LIVTGHRQVRNFYFGQITDFLNDKKTLFPSCFLYDNGGQILTKGHEVSMNFRIYFLDLVSVASDSKNNELEVQSDMLSVAKDIIALINAGSYSDWSVSQSNNYNLIRENESDLVAGVVVDVTIRTTWDTNYCEAPIY